MSSIPQQYIRIIENALKKNEDFALFRFPGETEFHLSGHDEYTVDIVRYGQQHKDAIRVGQSRRSLYHVDIFPSTSDKRHYLDSVAALAAYHKIRGGKTVLSRVIAGNGELSSSPLVFAQRYFDLNARSFCALINTANTGLWLIATPELLLWADETRLRTMSLAGTRPNFSALNHASNMPWDNKNKEEQAMVTDFIVDTWTGLGIEISTDGPSTMRTNNIEHLCTRIEGLRPRGMSIATILDATSPTPAVCGMPRGDSMNFIAAIESHNRDLYGGYIAVTCPDNTTRAYVTLRCARLGLDGRYAIYVGGGITGDSVPEDELRETDLKAHPLQSILTARNLTPVSLSSSPY